MLYYTLKRLGLAGLVALTVSFISFGLLYISSDPAIAMAGETASDADIEAIRQLYGFDRPILVQYFDWLQRAMSGDLGKSYYFRTDVSALIAERLSTTMTLGVSAITFAIVLSVPLGVAAAIRPNSLIDRIALFLSVMGASAAELLVCVDADRLFIGITPSIAHFWLGYMATFYHANNCPRLLRGASNYATNSNRHA